MKKWAFIDCFKEVNFQNIDFSDYEKVVFVTAGDIDIPIGLTHPSLEITLINVAAYTQEQADHALTFNLSKYDSLAERIILFDIYSNSISQTNVDSLLKDQNRYCNLFELPPDETITLQQALDNLIIKLNSYSDKRGRPRSLNGCLSRLNDDWRTLRGRVNANTLLNEMTSQGLISFVSNGIYFRV